MAINAFPLCARTRVHKKKKIQILFLKYDFFFYFFYYSFYAEIRVLNMTPVKIIRDKRRGGARSA